MAQLTLSQIAQMLAVQNFIDRVKIALIGKAHYWNNLMPGVLGDFNLLLQKRKRFAKQILAGNFPDMNSYASYILQLYTDANPDLNEDNQLSDSVLNNGTYQDPAYDHFAGAQSADADEPIIW